MHRNKKENGIYQIKPDNDLSFKVLCDQTAAGGGWTILGKRFDGSISFEMKDWKSYKFGFGSVDGEFWLGNENIHRMTSVRNEQLHLSGSDQDTSFAITYQNFQLESEERNYAMLYENPSPNDFNRFEVEKEFVTKNKDSINDCAKNYGPYWNTGQDCLQSNLFGVWNLKDDSGAQWYGENKTLVSLEMRIRPNQGKRMEYSICFSVHSYIAIKRQFILILVCLILSKNIQLTQSFLPIHTCI